MRSEEKNIEIRRVIGFMQFLGDTGGIYQSLFILGAICNFIFKGKDSSMQLLQYHFYATDAKLDKTRLKRWLDSFKERVKAGFFDKLLFGTILSWLPNQLIFFCCQKGKTEKFKKMIDQTNKHLDRTLDIRTILQMQSLILAMARILFIDSDSSDEGSLLALLSLQRGGKLLDMEDNEDSVENLLYPSDEAAAVSNQGILPISNDKKSM